MSQQPILTKMSDTPVLDETWREEGAELLSLHAADAQLDAPSRRAVLGGSALTSIALLTHGSLVNAQSNATSRGVIYSY
jgi:hypothetical protein